MGHVGIGHDQRVVADASESATFYRATIEGDKFTNLVVVSDFEARGFAGIGKILRRHANRAERKEAILNTDFGRSLDRNMRNQVASFTEFHVGANHAVRPNLARRMNFGLWVDD